MFPSALKVLALHICTVAVSCTIVSRKVYSLPDSSLSGVIKVVPVNSVNQCLVDCITVISGCASVSFNADERTCRLHHVHPKDLGSGLYDLPGFSLFAEGECDAGWLRHLNKCYFYSGSGDKRSWNNAKLACGAFGGSLVIVEDVAELDFISANSYGRGVSWFWLGAQWSPGTSDFRWLDGSIVMSEGWAANRPNDNAGCVDSCLDFNWLWNDLVDCSLQHAYICEKHILV